MLAVTRGECLNFFKGPASEKATNFVAGSGFAVVQAGFQTSNKRQCIKAAREIFS